MEDGRLSPVCFPLATPISSWMLKKIEIQVRVLLYRINKRPLWTEQDVLAAERHSTFHKMFFQQKATAHSPTSWDISTAEICRRRNVAGELTWAAYCSALINNDSPKCKKFTHHLPQRFQRIVRKSSSPMLLNDHSIPCRDQPFDSLWSRIIRSTSVCWPTVRTCISTPQCFANNVYEYEYLIIYSQIIIHCCCRSTSKGRLSTLVVMRCQIPQNRPPFPHGADGRISGGPRRDGLHNSRAPSSLPLACGHKRFSEGVVTIASYTYAGSVLSTNNNLCVSVLIEVSLLILPSGILFCNNIREVNRVL